MVSFHKYDSYKNSGVEWLGDIPEHWEVKKLKYIANQISLKNNLKNKQVNYLGLENIESWTGKLIETELIAEGVANSFSKNDILFGKLRPYLAKVHLAQNSGFCTTEALVLRFYQKYYIKFYFYLLISKGFIGLVNSSVYGTKMPRASWDFIGSQLLPLPPLPEQIKIAEFLDEKTTQIDNAISKKQRLIELLEEQKTIIINQAVTKGLNPNAPMKNSGIEWLGDIPESWEVCKLKFIKSKKKNAFVDGPFGSNLKSEHFIENGDVYVIESGHITSGIFRKKETFKTISLNHFQTISRSECQEGDIIIAKIGANYGMNAILPKLDKLSVVSGNSLKLSIDNNIALTEFIHYSLLDAKINDVFLDIVNTSAQPALSLGLLNNIKMPLPPIEEQEKIVNFIEQKTAEIDKLKEKTQQQIEKLKEYKQILIANAVTGKIKIS